MHKVLSWKITCLFQNYRYFSILTDAVRIGTICYYTGTVFITSNPSSISYICRLHIQLQFNYYK